MELGKWNTLKIARVAPPGAYLTDGELEVLLPNRYFHPEKHAIGDDIKVFYYKDSEDRPVAVTDAPIAEVDQFGAMQVKSVLDAGAFLDWGLEKDLFLPKREMHRLVKEGEVVTVRVCVDHRTDRLVASAKIQDFLTQEGVEQLKPGDAVSYLVYQQTDLGFRCIVNGKHSGFLYKQDPGVGQLGMGSQGNAFINRVREDQKIDLSLKPVGRQAREEAEQKILDLLQVHQGYLELTDQSSPEEIFKLCGLSKKAFKKGVGALFRQQIIRLEDEGIRLLKFDE